LNQAEGFGYAQKALPPRAGWRLLVMRLLALIFMLACVLTFLAGTLVYQPHAALNPESYSAFSLSPLEMDQIFNRVGLSFTWWIRYNLVGSVLFALLICSIGFLIFYRNQKDWYGVYVAASLVLFGTQTGYPTSALYGMYPALEAVLMPLGVLAWLGLFLIFFAFPDGRFRPTWTRWAAAGLVVSYLIDILVYGGNIPPVPLLLLIFLFVGSGVGSQVYRYRAFSTSLQRQQTKWVMLALMVVFAVLLFTMIPFLAMDKIDPESPLALVLLMMSSSAIFVMSLIPLSIAFAILRYRLWDVDIIIRRTLLYGALSASLGLVYLGMVVVLQWLLVALTGESRSEVASVITTLAIAALFTPLRKRIQRDIDRRFYRKKYSAEQTLLSFAALARQETDIDALTEKFISVVSETIQPEYLNLWIVKEEVKGTREA
jgi:hypothetical protein